MTGLQAMVRRNLITILLVLLLGGFVMLLVELLITNHVGGIQNVANVASVVGAAAILLGFFAKGTFRHLLVLLLLVLSMSGLLGAWEHLESREGGEAQAPAALAVRSDGYQTISNGAGADVERTLQEDDEEGEEAREGGEGGEREGGEGAPPPLAPLSLSGLALMGAVVLLAKPDARELAERVAQGISPAGAGGD